MLRLFRVRRSRLWRSFVYLFKRLLVRNDYSPDAGPRHGLRRGRSSVRIRIEWRGRPRNCIPMGWVADGRVRLNPARTETIPATASDIIYLERAETTQAIR